MAHETTWPAGRVKGADRSPDERISADATDSQMEVQLAYGQRSLWFLHEGEPGTAAHSLAAAVPLRGQLDIAALACALDALVARHASLRAAFPYAHEESVQPVADRAGEWLQEYDARDLDDAQLTKWLEYAAREPLDRAPGPLLRIDLYRRSPDETVMLMVARQVVTDSWSMRTLACELEASYFGQTGSTPAAPSGPADTNGGFVRLYLWGGRPRRPVHAASSPDFLICPSGQ